MLAGVGTPAGDIIDGDGIMVGTIASAGVQGIIIHGTDLGDGEVDTTVITIITIIMAIIMLEPMVDLPPVEFLQRIQGIVKNMGLMSLQVLIEEPIPELLLLGRLRQQDLQIDQERRMGLQIDVQAQVRRPEQVQVLALLRVEQLRVLSLDQRLPMGQRIEEQLRVPNLDPRRLMVRTRDHLQVLVRRALALRTGQEQLIAMAIVDLIRCLSQVQELLDPLQPIEVNRIQAVEPERVLVVIRAIVNQADQALVQEALLTLNQKLLIALAQEVLHQEVVPQEA